MLAGVDVFMMMHPAAVKTVRDVISKLTQSGSRGRPEQINDWVSLKI